MKQVCALLVLVAGGACGPANVPPGTAAEVGAGTGAAAPAVPATTRPAASPAPEGDGPAFSAAPPLSVRVTSVSRLGAGVIEVRLVLHNGGPTPARLPATAGAGAPGGGLAAALLEDGEGRYRTAVLRDSRGEALCSAGTEEIPAGGHREAWLHFAVDARDAAGLRVRLPGLPPSPLPVAGG